VNNKAYKGGMVSVRIYEEDWCNCNSGVPMSHCECWIGAEYSPEYAAQIAKWWAMGYGEDGYDMDWQEKLPSRR
jgi:hypothetical protein